MQHIQMQLSPNKKTFAQFFSEFPESTKNLEIFEKNYGAQRLFLFWNYRLQIAGLL